jgi:flavodoxin
MKNAVVYYSYDGSTRVAAKIIADKFKADLFELEEVKKRGHSPFSFVAAGFSASVGKGSRLKSTFENEMKEYGSIYIGTPIWAGKSVPAVNTFIKKLNPKGKEVILFTVQADRNADVSSVNCIHTMKSLLEKKGASVIKTAGLCGAGPGETAKTDDMKKQIENKL